MLWWAAWKQCPAGSLPDHDRALAQLAGYGMVIKSWLAIKNEAMRGWIRCSDGRLYHPVVCELAIEAMERRTEHQESNGNRFERQRRWRQRVKELAAELRERGITPPKGASLETMERLLVDASVDASPSTVDVPRDGGWIGETGQDRTKKESVLRTAPAEPSPNPKAALWREGLAAIQRLTGKPEAAVRKMLGNLSDVAKHDHGGLLALIRKAEAEPPDDPIAWLTAAAAPLNGRCAPAPLLDELADDGPWGIDAWIARQSDVRIEPDGRTGNDVATLNGHGVAYHANRVAEAAGLSVQWRGQWDGFGNWLRDDVEITSETLAAVSRQAAQMRARGQTVSSIKVFDAAVRGAARVPA